MIKSFKCLNSVLILKFIVKSEKSILLTNHFIISGVFNQWQIVIHYFNKSVIGPQNVKILIFSYLKMLLKSENLRNDHSKIPISTVHNCYCITYWWITCFLAKFGPSKYRKMIFLPKRFWRNLKFRPHEQSEGFGYL